MTLKIVFAYNCWNERAFEYHESIIDAGRQLGFDISSFTLTPNAPKERYTWRELDVLWRLKYPPLLSMKKQLIKTCRDADILWVYNGANFHPEWLKELPDKLLTVYGCFDDPEASSYISEPVAKYFDACLVGNKAALPMYKAWGCQNVAWAPIFISPIERLSDEDFSQKCRDIDLIFFGENISGYRKDRLSTLEEAFPDAHFYGRGWKNGFITDADKKALLRRAKIGINLHNSTGPINYRLFELPANGVLQVCDNKILLNEVFKLNSEVVGYDFIDDAILQIKKLLKDDKKRMEIAQAGYERYLESYEAKKLWVYYVDILTKWHTFKQQDELVYPSIYSRNNLKSSLKKHVSPVFDQIYYLVDVIYQSCRDIIYGNTRSIHKNKYLLTQPRKSLDNAGIDEIEPFDIQDFLIENLHIAISPLFTNVREISYSGIGKEAFLEFIRVEEGSSFDVSGSGEVLVSFYDSLFLQDPIEYLNDIKQKYSELLIVLPKILAFNGKVFSAENVEFLLRGFWCNVSAFSISNIKLPLLEIVEDYSNAEVVVFFCDDKGNS